MARQVIDVGTAYDDPSADKQRDANVMINANFAELYAALAAAGVLVTGIAHAVIEIGAWNMDSTLFVAVAYEPPAGYAIAGFSAMIMDNNANNYDSIDNSADLGGDYQGYITYDVGDGEFTLVRVASGLFDSANYNDAVMNRGYIHVVLKAIS